MLELRFLDLTRNCKVNYDQTIKCLTRQWKFERLKQFFFNTPHFDHLKPL